MKARAKTTAKPRRPYIIKKIKTYTVKEILDAGGTTAFAKLTNYDSKKFHHLKGEPLTDEEYRKAIKMLTR